MTKPDDIPQDVWDTAQDHAETYVADERMDVETIVARAIMAERDRLTDPQFLAKHIESIGLVGREAVDEAVMAEREACAQVASGFVAHSNTRDVDQAMQEAASANTAESIAAAIRNRGAA